jgi:hypothetical protein
MNAVVADQPLTSAAEMIPASSPMQLVERAMAAGNMELVERFMALQERWEAAQAKKAYIVAFSQFKQNMPDVIKDMLNKQYDSEYSSLANLVNEVSKVMAKYELHHQWDPVVSGNVITMKCIVTHSGGHSETVTIPGPPDTTGAKNQLQQIKSAITYLEGATFQAITGVVARAANKDDDGNGAGNRNEPPKEPNGYATWKADMELKAEEGYEPFSTAWKATAKYLREHALKVDADWRQKTIDKAKAADEARLK